MEPDQDLAAGADEGQCLIPLAGADSADDVDARNHRAIVVGRPADESEEAAGRKSDDALLASDPLLGGNFAKADPVLDLALAPGELHHRRIRGKAVRPLKRVHGAPPTVGTRGFGRSGRLASSPLVEPVRDLWRQFTKHGASTFAISEGCVRQNPKDSVLGKLEGARFDLIGQ